MGREQTGTVEPLAGNELVCLYCVGPKNVAQILHSLRPFFGNSSENHEIWTQQTKGTRVGAAKMTGRIQSTANWFPESDGKRFSTSTPKTRLQVPAFLGRALRVCEVLPVLRGIFAAVFAVFQWDRLTIKTGNLYTENSICSPRHHFCSIGRNAFFQRELRFRNNPE